MIGGLMRAFGGFASKIAQRELDVHKADLEDSRKQLIASISTNTKLCDRIKELLAKPPSSGPLGPMASTSESVAELDDTVSRLLTRLQELHRRPGNVSMDEKAQRIALVINRTLDEVGSAAAKAKISTLIVRHASTRSSAAEMDRLLAMIHSTTV